MPKNKNNLIKSKDDLIIDSISLILVVFATVAFLYPVIYIISLSLSSAETVEARKIWLYPMGLNINAYKLIFHHKYLIRSFGNSVIYAIAGTIYSLILTIFGAYSLSHKELRGRNFFMMMIFFTMLFSGGLIPTYLLVQDLGMIDTIWAMIIPVAISPWNLIVMRTMFQQNPVSLEESAKIEGANHLQILFRIIVPISMPVVATIALFYFVGKWNDYFNGLIYLTTKNKFPLQLIARELLVTMSDQTLNQETLFNPEMTYAPQTFGQLSLL